MTGPRRLADLLSPPDSALAGLVREARHRQRLDGVLDAFLDRPLRDHVHVASARDGLLVLAADTPVWGHRVRYLAPALLQRMREEDPRLEDVRIIVRPPRSDAPEPPAPRRTALSSSSASLLERVAAACDNPELERALRRLASRARGPTRDA